MKQFKLTPFVFGMIFTVQAVANNVAAPNPNPLNIISQPLIVKSNPLTSEVLVGRSKGVLLNHKLLNFLNALLKTAEEEGMQRDWFVDDQLAALLNSYVHKNDQENLRKSFYNVAIKILSSLNAGYIQPEQLGDKTNINVFTKLNAKGKKVLGSKKYFVEELRKMITDDIYSVESRLNFGVPFLLVRELFDKYRPKNANYKRLLAMYQNISSLHSQGKITDNEIPLASKLLMVGPKGPYPTDKKNNPTTFAADYKAAITFVRKRLNLFGYANDTSIATYSDDLKAAIVDFQDNNLLDRDGVIGSESYRVLTRPIEQIITLLKINLDRSRWLPDQLGSEVPVGSENPMPSEYVHVNLAAQRFFYYKNDIITESFKTINGEKDRPTAIMTSNLTQMILNPTWTVAPTPYFKDKALTFSKEIGLYDFIYKNYTIKEPKMEIISAYPEAQDILDYLTINQNGNGINVYSEDAFLNLSDYDKQANVQQKLTTMNKSKMDALIAEKLGTLTQEEVNAVLTVDQKNILIEKEKANLTEEQKATFSQDEILALVTKEKFLAALTSEQKALLTEDLIKIDLMKEVRAEVLSQDENNKANWKIIMKLFSLERKRYLVSSGQSPDPVTGAYLTPMKADSIMRAVTIVQRPDGNLNALGWIKFPLANTGAVFMHDTNDRKLFKDKNRLLSSGCVRLEKPFEIASILMAGKPATGASTENIYTVEYLKSLTVKRYPIATQQDPELSLGRKIPVYLLYDTAQINDRGQMTLVPDPYGVDMDMYNLMMGIPLVAPSVAPTAQVPTM